MACGRGVTPPTTEMFAELFAQFCRQIGRGDTSATVSMLASLAVDQLGADAAVVFVFGADGRVAHLSSRGLSASTEPAVIDAEPTGADLGRALLTALGGAFGATRVVRAPERGPTVALSLLYHDQVTSTPTQLLLAKSLTELATMGSGASQRAQPEGRPKSDEAGDPSTLLHDIRNLLHPLVLHLQLLRRRVPAGNRAAQDSVTNMERVLSRARDLLGPKGSPAPTATNRVDDD